MLIKNLIFWGSVFCVILLDQATKAWVRAEMALHQSVPVIDGFFNLTYVRNTGVAFGMFAGRPGWGRTLLFAGISILAMWIILRFFKRLGPGEYLWVVGLALVFGGAWGNLIDRLWMGYVVDFLDVYWGSLHWPAFNVADSSVTVGSFTLLFRILRDKTRSNVS